MKKKIVVIILIVILFVLGFVVYKFIDNIKEDQTITSEKASEIVKAYDKFNSSIQAFATMREEYYTSRQNTFLEELASDVDSWNDFVS
ncbi:MAG: hypothetical protein IJ093_04820, partial [Bacilli bacterium]|nr:hypothetical protein [Bacilli bacterium]